MILQPVSFCCLFNLKTNRWLCNRSLSPSEDKSGNDTRQEKETENEPPLICAAGEGESAEPSTLAASKKYRRQTNMCYFCETDVQKFRKYFHIKRIL
ncbi:unnamed protein product [Acanthoscelides obtectus]|uniref:Uncharacterized protein n=1 Tax=Acanthoscelides obtectus TaxID=200917 RepID=A0A9P0Q2E3_ACAOB|nr:unnamed protein product [Acanthoscelides obtectus]CAH2003281.1 unnamed protein product [Acanthoscelides obtectus]CAK1656285.1 hypothetical protein AOBTE_LOCUS19642 [Acanthoscelides obtectus]CAK1687555.1 hypothetical protein AOBTE_LOCUS36284 [Acanthoscelides obtectus]